ncbi:MAG: TolC family protein [Bacteroidota bacterium]
MKQLLWSCLFSLPLMLLAQDTLTLDAAIQQALESNYDIRVARYNIESATNNAQPGMAGLLPEISATAGVNYSNSSGSADFPGVDSVTGERIVVTQSASGIETNSQNVGLNLNYTVFSGLANKSNYQILQKNVELTEAQVRAQIGQSHPSDQCLLSTGPTTSQLCGFVGIGAGLPRADQLPAQSI